MWIFLSRMVANAAGSFTVGGTVLAVGVAIGAVGLAESQRMDTAPFNNELVVTGLITVLLGAAWVFLTFALAVMTTAKSERFRTLLGQALHSGETLAKKKYALTWEEVRAWAQEVADLIGAAIGEHEARLFLSDYDLGVTPSSGKNRNYSWLQRRVQRLARLLDRVHAMNVSLSFKGRHEWLSPAVPKADASTSPHEPPEAPDAD